MKNELGIRKLIEFVWQTGDLHGELFSSDNTALQGAIIHRHLQKKWDKSYSAEFSLQTSVQVGEQTYTLNGRADGVHQTNGSYDRVIEIKTSALNFDDLSLAKQNLYWAQLKMYAAILIKDTKLKQIKLELIYVQTSNEQITHKYAILTKKEADKFFNKTIAVFTEWASLKQRMFVQRNHSISKLHFPFKDYRPRQHELAAAVYKTIAIQKRLFVEAPTGTGKTISTLFPAIMALGQNKTTRIFYLTAKESTRQVAEQSLMLLQQEGLKLHSITLTAKEKITFAEEKEIEDSKNPYFVGYYDRLKPALKDILQNETLISTDIIKKYAQKHMIDPFEFSLDVSLFCDVVIGDYNYLFDPLVYLQRFFQDSAQDYCFLVDEAHNLVARSRSMYTAEISSAPLKNILIKLKHSTPAKTTKKIQTYLERFQQAFTKSKAELSATKALTKLSAKCPTTFLKYAQRFILKVQTWLKQNSEHPLFQSLLDYYLAVHTFIKISSFYNKTFRTKLTLVEKNVVIKIFCLNPSSLLNLSLAKGKSAILFSATLSPITYYQDVLGGQDEVLAYTLSSPFKAKKLGLFVTPKLNVSYRFRAQNESRIIAALTAMVHARSGNYLVFLPSYAFLKQIYTAFSQINPDIKTIYQDLNMTPEAKAAFLATFKRQPLAKVTGFAVLGGSFAEGIDLKGDALSGVAIISVGLPAFNEETEELKEFFEQTYASGFEYAYQLPGFNNVLQAAGRVIRGMNDTGVLLLLDQRFNTKRYTRLFPAHWQHYQQSYSLDQLKKQLAFFWKYVNSNY
ncbi:helicase C-terminal domain-containing protein [Liquorilactobacillus capillatus]|uniref:DNA 5'-3' helicase n=1 Tax=Liquorilactobacillus capillatus DSM 19910 TaxID=1423731 RepID=A0A0R1M825_9LACO|nr:helicase C-terminal domain-containing protein [Liquorilactobacillus capillatus]KRL01844.1 Superfamily II DNA and RNA helicase [Liquorilactobacillus capillatus DSM 19910]